MKVLNVGGASKDIPLPPQYAGWQHTLLDIDPDVRRDVVCDAREMSRLPAAQYDAVYCSHKRRICTRSCDLEKRLDLEATLYTSADGM